MPRLEESVPPTPTPAHPPTLGATQAAAVLTVAATARQIRVCLDAND